MTQPAHPGPETLAAEARLAPALAAARRQLAAVPTALSCMLGNLDPALVSDRIAAQVRAFAADLARQLAGDASPGAERVQAQFAAALLDAPAVVAHLHAVAVEAQLIETLAGRLGLDPVVSPLLQALAASAEPGVAGDAAALLAAQARFDQAHRRGELSSDALPGDVLRLAVLLRDNALGEAAPTERPPASPSRLALLERAIRHLGNEAPAARDLERAGVALFASAVALGAGIDRDLALLTMTRGQRPRLALTLIAAGLAPAAVQRQLFALDPDAEPLPDLTGIAVSRAAALLDAGGADAR